jgi:hypothetical protein
MTPTVMRRHLWHQEGRRFRRPCRDSWPRGRCPAASSLAPRKPAQQARPRRPCLLDCCRRGRRRHCHRGVGSWRGSGTSRPG